MALSLKKQTEALEILTNYTGNNPYILSIRRDFFSGGKSASFNDFQKEFVLENKNFQPKPINKVVPIAEWYGESLKNEWHIDFVPAKLKINSFLGSTTLFFVVYAQYRLSLEPILLVLPKKAVLKDFLCTDYNLVDVDFDRYDRLAESNRLKLGLSEFPHILKPHQKKGIQFLLARKKCILADDMGCGKTTTLAVAALEGNFDSILLIVPASLKTQWKEELSYYINPQEITVIDGFNGKTKPELEEFLGYGIGKSGKKRDELLEEAKSLGKWKHNRVVIVNYDIVDEFFTAPKGRTNTETDEFVANNPMYEYIKDRKSLIIIDEAHNLSNAGKDKVRYNTIKSLIRVGKPDSIYLSTGTPVTNDPKNFYAILSLIENDVTGDYDYYMEHYCDAKEFVHPKDKEKRNRISAAFIAKKGKKSWYDLTDIEKIYLNAELKRSCRFIKSAQGASNLDELESRVSHIYLRRLKKEILTDELPEKLLRVKHYELSAEQLMEYNKLWDEFEAEKKRENPEAEVNKDLLEGGLYRRYLSKEMVANTIKLADKMLAKNEKVVIACCYDEELYILQKYYGEKCVIYNGSMDIKHKDAAKDKFLHNPDVMVFIGNLRSAGTGLNLVVARYLIFNDFDYVPGNNRQMEDRIYRIGQQRPCCVFYQMFDGTEYEHMWNTVIRKEAIINQVIKTESEK